MFAEPADLDRQQLSSALASGWGINSVALDYQPVGFGTHHFVSGDDSAAVWFVNVDDLATKPAGADQAFDDLDRALRTALALQNAGLEFVHAPIIHRSRGVLDRFGHYTVSVYPFIDGTSQPYGEYASDQDRRQALSMLGRMHAASCRIPADLPRHETLEVPFRQQLFQALAALDVPWKGGPYSEPARRALIINADPIRELFAAFAELAVDVARGRSGWVVTHGEPHAANMMRTKAGDFMLIDWDTAALGPRERDLWMVEPHNDDDWDAYTSSGGSADVDLRALELYRTLWTLGELSLYTCEFRAPHVEDANTRIAWGGFLSELPAD